MSQDTRRADLERNLALAEAAGYTHIIENNRRLLAALDAREAAPAVAPTAAQRARALRSLVWSWLPEEPGASNDAPAEEPAELSQPRQSEPPTVGDTTTVELTSAEKRATALAALEQVRDAQQFLANWTDRLIRIASDNDATNPEIGARLGVGKERIRRRLLQEPPAAA